MLTLEKAIAAALKPRTITNLYTLLDDIKKRSKTDLGDFTIFDHIETYLVDHGITDIYIDHEEEKVIYREQLFANTAFRVQLTPEEFADKHVVIGHRFLPFFHPSTPPDQLVLLDEKDVIIPMLSEKRNLVDNIIYFSMLPPYGLEHYELGSDGSIEVFLFDLAEWMTSNKFTIKDNILVTPVDHKNNTFRIEKLSSRDIRTQKIADARKDTLLTEAIQAQLAISEVLFPIDIQLFQAFANCDASILNQAGTPVGPFISNHPDIHIFNNGMYAYLNSQENIESTIDHAMDEAMYPDVDSFGTATDIAGIFAEMGISYTEEFLMGKMIEQLNEHQQIDKVGLYAMLFKNGQLPFYNEEQETNFETAFTSLSKYVTQQWGNQPLSLPEKKLLTQTLRLKVDIIGLLRDIDAKITDPDQFDISLLMQIQPFELVSDNLLALLTDPEEEKPNDLLRDLSKQMKEMHSEFQITRNHILSEV